MNRWKYGPRLDRHRRWLAGRCACLGLVAVVGCAPPIIHPARVKAGLAVDLAGGPRVVRFAPPPEEADDLLRSHGGSADGQVSVRYGWRLGDAGALLLGAAIPILVVNGHVSLYYQLPVEVVDFGIGANAGFLPGVYAMVGGHRGTLDAAIGFRAMRFNGAGPLLVIRRGRIGLFAEALFLGTAASFCYECSAEDYFDRMYSAGLIFGR